VRLRLDEAIRGALGTSRVEMGQRWSMEDQEPVWFIRRLVVEVSVNAALAREHVAYSLTSGIVTALARVMKDGSDGDNVVRFESRAAHLARFLADLARGTAWTHWYHGGFAGLRALPVSCALRTALLADPALALTALLSLALSTLGAVLAQLTPSDARRVHEQLPHGECSDVARALAAAWSVYRASVAAGGDPDDRLTLRICIEAVREDPEVAGPALRAVTAALVDLANLLARAPGIDHAELSGAIARGDAASVSGVTAHDWVRLAPLTRCPPELVADVVRGVAAAAPAVAVADGAGDGERRGTQFGALFLLLPFLDALPIAEATAGWPAPDHGPAETFARLVIALKCLGGRSAVWSLGDPVVRDVLAVPPELGTRELVAWQSRITSSQRRRFVERVGAVTPGPRANKIAADRALLALPLGLRGSRALEFVWYIAARRVLAKFAASLPGFAASSATHLHENFLNIRATIESDDTRHVVRLGRPPLYLVLATSGLARRSYRVGWLDARPFELFPEDAA